MRIFALCCLLFVFSSAAPSQIFVPDNDPTVGTCNSIPFSQSAYTYVGRVPASFLSLVNPRIDDLAFAPCNSGTFTAPQFILAIGHLPPVAGNITYPTVSSGVPTSFGAFSDLTVMYDSAIQGPFTWTYSANTWSPMNFPTMGVIGNFFWNGIDDIGVYISLGQASGGSTMHRTSTEPYRWFTGGFQATASTGNSAAGSKMELIVGGTSPGVPEVNAFGSGCGTPTGPGVATIFSTQLPSLGNAAFTIELASAPINQAAFLFAAFGFSQPSLPLGGGCELYLDPVSLNQLITTGFSPFGPQATGMAGSTAFPLPVPNDPGLTGARIYWQAAVTAATPLGFVVSNGLETVLNP